MILGITSIFECLVYSVLNATYLKSSFIIYNIIKMFLLLSIVSEHPLISGTG